MPSERGEEEEERAAAAAAAAAAAVVIVVVVVVVARAGGLGEGCRGLAASFFLASEKKTRAPAVAGTDEPVEVVESPILGFWRWRG